MAESKWIRFEKVGRPRGRLTDIFLVVTKDGGKDGAGFAELGEIRWHAPWRRFAFFPADATLYESQCLRDLAAFCDEQTEARRRARLMAKGRKPGLDDGPPLP